MKNGLRYARLSAFAAAALVGTRGLRAANLFWDPSQSTTGPTDGNGNWDNATPNWFNPSTGGLAVFNSSTPDSAIFGTSNVGAAGNVNPFGVQLTDNVTVQNITFNTSATGASYQIIDDGNGETLTLAGNVTKAAAFGNPQIALNNSVVLTAGNHTFAINDTSGDANPELEINNQNATFGLTGAGTVTLNNGSYSQYGTLLFVTDNNYTGGTNIIKGRLTLLTGGGLGTTGTATIGAQGNLAFGSSGLFPAGSLTVTTPINITRNTYVGTDFSDYPDAISVNNGGGPKTVTFAGPFTVDSTDARVAAFTNTVVISGNIAQGPDVTAGVLTLDGDLAGFVNLTGNNTALKGGLALIGGVELTATTEANLAGATSPLNLSGGEIHIVAGSALATDGFGNDFGSAALGFGGHTINNGTSATALGTLNTGLDLDGGVTFNASSLYGVSLGTRGTGTLNFNGTNVFSGVPFFNAGTVNVNGNTSVGAFRLRSPVLNINSGGSLTTTNSYTDVGTDSPDSGTVNVLGSGQLILANQDFNVSDNAGTSGVLNLSGSAVVTNLGSSYFSKSPNTTATLTMSGASSFVTNGSLVFGRNPGATGSATVGGTSVLTANGSSTSPNYGIGFGIAGGTGTLTMTGGTVNANANVGGSFALGNANGQANVSTGTLVMSGGTINVAGETWIGTTDNGNNSLNDAGQGNAFATVQMSGGTLIGNSWMAIGRFGAQGTFNLSGGQVIKQGGNNAYVGETNPAVTSVLTISGTGFWNNSTGEFWVGQGGGVGVLNITGAGSLVANSWLAVGRAGGFGTVNLTSGTLTQQASNHLSIGSGGTGTVNVSGGALTGLNTYIGETGTTFGILNLNGGNTVLNGVTTFGNAGSVSGTLNLNAGTLTAAQFVAGGSNGTQTFNFNGGSLIASAASTSYLSGLTAANVLAGGANVNTSSYAITIGQGLLGNATSTGGGLVKTGTGVLTLGGNNTYAGRTVVNGGTLVSANAGALPSGTGLTTAASTAVNFNGQYGQPFNSPSAGLTLSNLVAGGGDTFGFGSTPAGLIDSIAYNAASSVTGSNLINLVLAGGTNISNGTYNLFTDTFGGLGTAFRFSVNGGTTLASGGSTTFTTNGRAFTLTFSEADTFDRLVVSTAPTIAKLYYIGQAGSTDFNSAGNFTIDSTGTTASVTPPGSITDVVLTATANVANTTPTVTGTAAANSLEFNNAAGVTLGGTGTLNLSAGANTFLAGTAIVVDAGAGASTISANLNLLTPSGTTTQFVQNGANQLQIAGGVNLASGSPVLFSGTGAGRFNVSGTVTGTIPSVTFNGSGGVTFAGASSTLNLTGGTPVVVSATSGNNSIGANLVLGSATPQFNTSSPNPTRFTGVISGATSPTALTYGGTGTGGFIVNGANTYSGTTIVNGPAVQLGSGSALGSAANNLVLTAGSVDLFGQQVTQSSMNLSGGRLFGSLGTGTLTLTNTGANASVVINASYPNPQTVGTVTGQLVLPAGGSIDKSLNAGQPVFTGNVALNGATTITLADSPGDAAPELALAGNVSGGSAASLTLNNQATYNGLTQLDTSDYGTLLLSGTNSYGGGTNIASGKVVVTSNGALGTGPVTIVQRSAGGGGVLSFGDGNYSAASSPLAVANNLTSVTLSNPILLGGQVSGVYGYGIYNDNGNNTLSGPVTLTNAAQILFVNGGSLTVSNVIGESFTGAELIKRGGATLNLTGTGNTYTGPTQIVNGLLVINSLANGGSPSSIGASSASPANLLLDGGTIQYNGSNVTSNRGYTLQATTAFNAGPANVTLGGQILSTGGSFTKNGAGTLTYTNATGTNTYETAGGFPGYIVNQGVVNIGAPGATASGQVNVFQGEVDAGATGQTGNAEIDFNSGTTTINSYISADRGSTTTGLTGTINVNTDAVVTVQNLSTGYNNNVAGYNANIFVNLNGTSTFNDTGVFRLAENVGSTVVLTVNNSASLNVSSGSTGQLQVGYQGVGVVNQTGGTVTTTGVQMGFDNAGTTTGNGTYNLSGGTLRTSNVYSNGGGTTTFNFNGGTLQANTASPSLMTGLTAANVMAGGAKIDTQSFAAAIAQNLASGVANDGGLTKLGSGTLTLTGTNTYVGTTVVSAGTLATGTTGTLGLGNVTVGTASTGAVLTLGNATSIADTATLSFGNGSTINLNAANTGSGSTETVTSLFNLTTQTAFNTPGTYSAAYLDGQFGDAVFASLNGETLTIVGAPEPASLLLVGSAVAPLLLGRRRGAQRRRAATA